ncbi:MAG: HWE histidine kinase domain-containing protein [Phenylobacterium sp.]|uniref:sensor histidine kinase n=1 Tax=Phenylobacterium sp. TaxID=1871053 RepID=UPI00271E1BCD|nr:HWE histidine kinase domain-containing protein [Phenylobacterium sp.]MDO8902123.1 HWE histidine kinase domain-containing protein [Phenylobacterium sp.]MDP2213192.1 HWE histidine kinase domain-containing protein [Phenylobacterium sp.]
MIDPDLAFLIVQNARDYAVFTLEPDGRIAAWSPGAETIFGYSSHQAIGLPFAELFLAPDVAAGIPEAEMAKAYRDGRAEDTRWHLRQSGERFWANGVTMTLGDRPQLIKFLRDETAAKLAEDQRILLLNELNHRIKNTLATVQSIVENTLRAAHIDTATRSVLTERLIALAQAHNVLVAESWAGADLRSIVDQALAPHITAGGGRFRIEGPRVFLSPQQAVSLSLVLHELTTNAIKYGALSSDEGEVTLSWNTAHNASGARSMTLLWQESGGPPVKPPNGREGFGLRLIARSFGQDGDGRTRLEYSPEGVRCTVNIPLSQGEEFPILSLGDV